ncbi:MAG: helix-turn-helix domain-containing protein [Pseudonocardia sp.]|nr:helix-turn-helix domain-containing protein [Pseudonocardia sp.]
MQPTTIPTRPSSTPTELAQMVNVNIRTVRRLIAAGEIRAFRIGRSVRIPADEIDRLTSRKASA